MFLSHVDMDTGMVNSKGHEVQGECVKDKIIVAPSGKGSTGDESSLLCLKEAGVAPKAVILGSPIYTPGVIGAIIAGIPMVYGLDSNSLGIIEKGDHVRVDADNGVVEVVKK
jgi:hypothetical protein